MFQRSLLAVSTTAALIVSLLAAQPAMASPTTAADLPQLLRVQEPDTAHKYDRAVFEHWIDADGDGCNTRYEVLIAESTTPPASSATPRSGTPDASPPPLRASPAP